MVRIIKMHDVKCSECGNEFETKLTENIQCGRIMSDRKRCGKRFDLKGNEIA